MHNPLRHTATQLRRSYEAPDPASLRTARQRYEHAVLKQREKDMEAAFLRILHDQYPGYIWKIEVCLTNRNQFAKIQLPLFMHHNQHWIVHLNRVADANALVRVLNHAGGEMLERLRMPRSMIDVAAAETFMAANPLANRQTLPE